MINPCNKEFFQRDALCQLSWEAILAVAGLKDVKRSPYQVLGLPTPPTKRVKHSDIDEAVKMVAELNQGSGTDFHNELASAARALKTPLLKHFIDAVHLLDLCDEERPKSDAARACTDTCTGNAAHWWWQWNYSGHNARRKVWKFYERSVSGLIEEAYKNRKVDVEITVDGKAYVLDLCSYTQTRLDDPTRQRKIRRHHCVRDSSPSSEVRTPSPSPVRPKRKRPKSESPDSDGWGAWGQRPQGWHHGRAQQHRRNDGQVPEPPPPPPAQPARCIYDPEGYGWNWHKDHSP